MVRVAYACDEECMTSGVMSGVLWLSGVDWCGLECVGK